VHIKSVELTAVGCRQNISGEHGLDAQGT